MAYVNTETLKRNIRVNFMPNVDVDGTVTVENAERYFLNLIDKTSTTDVVDVTCRCGKCKYWKRKRKGIFGEYVGDCYNTDFPFSSEQRPIMKESDYCSYGKRKE